MAKKTSSAPAARQYRAKSKRRRPGVHAKSKSSKCKSSRNYRKLGRGQG